MADHDHHRYHRRRRRTCPSLIASIVYQYLALSSDPFSSASSLSSSLFALAFQQQRRPGRHRQWQDGVVRYRSSCAVVSHKAARSTVRASKSLQSIASEDSNLLEQKTRTRHSCQRSIILVSLPPKTDSAPASVRQTWKWKDVALGDGRDYFVPRPRALSALNGLLVGTRTTALCSIDNAAAAAAAATGNQTRYEYVVEECGVLSNCARLDCVLVVSGPVWSDSEHNDYENERNVGGIGNITTRRGRNSSSSSRSSMASQAAKRIVGEALAAQLISYESRKKNAALDGLASLLDLAGVINDSPPPVDNDVGARGMASELESVLVSVEGSYDVCHHLCRVASGMAERPSRPGRDVPFRPFSSRDAHVMLQIKRTAEVASGPRVRALLDASLQAGKAVRDPDQVPDIMNLKSYGTDGRYSRDAPSHLTREAVEAATSFGIEPAVEWCLSRLQAMDSSEAVQNLRSRVERKMVSAGIDLGGDDGLVVRRILHVPCLAIREGKEVAEHEVLQQICRELGIAEKDWFNNSSY